MNKFFLITGFLDPLPVNPNVSYSSIKSSGFEYVKIFKIPPSNIGLGIPRKNWTRGTSYTGYSLQNQTDISKSYVMYNQKVYLCLNNNDNNLPNIINSSTYPPTHSNGIVKYPDGYSWLYLYKITANVENMVNSSTIPAPSTYGLKQLVINRETDDIECGLTAGITGTCGIYLTDFSKTSASLIYQAGLSCSVCLNMAEETTKTDLLTTIFYPTGITASSTIEIKSPKNSLEQLIQSKKIDTSLNFEASCYDSSKTSGLSGGSILSAQINIQSIYDINPNYLILNDSELTITISDGGGTGALIEFIKIPESPTSHKITGIQVTKHGQNYPVAPSILLSGITNNEKKASILGSIVINGTSPSLTFEGVNSIFDVASVNSVGAKNTTRIVNAQIDAHLQDTSFYALIEADSYTEETPEALIPGSLTVYEYSSTGLTFGREYLNLIFNLPVNQTEILMR